MREGREGGIGEDGKMRPLHDGEDDIGLILNGCESHRCDHYDHKIECLDPVSLERRKDVDSRLSSTYPIGRC